MVQTLNSDSFLFYFGILSAAAPSFGWMLFLRYLVGFYIGGVPQVCANKSIFVSAVTGHAKNIFC